MPAPLYILLHLYKTAGQTLEANIRLNLDRPAAVPLYVGPMGLDISKASGSPANPGWLSDRVTQYVAEQVRPQTQVVFGHMAFYGLHTFVQRPVTPRYVVFLRDPIERVISLYYYLRNKSVNHWHHEIVNAGWDLEEWLERSQALWHRNGQLRQLILAPDESATRARDLGAEHLALARRNLDASWYVGLTETFEADAQYLYGRLGFQKFHPEARVNVTPQKPVVPERVRQLIAEHNALDLELYRAAQRRRAEIISSRRVDFMLQRTRAAARRWRYRRQQKSAQPDSARSGQI